MKKLLVLLAASTLGARLGQAQAVNPKMEMQPGRVIICPARPESAQTQVAPPAAFLQQSGQSLTNASGATITVTYTGFSAQAQAAFQYAVDVWKTQLSSPVTIHIDATWSKLDQGVLGSAGPSTFVRDFSGALQANTFYPIALAEKLAGTDLNGPTEADITASFNSDAAWYYGTDGKTPIDKYDLATVVLHELGHGLGFFSSSVYDNGTSQGGYGISNALPLTFDTFLENTARQRLTDAGLFPNPSVALGTEYTHNAVYFGGPLAMAANPKATDKRPHLYAPTFFLDGSSISHLDENTYPAGDPNSLMTYAVAAAEAIHDPGPLVRGMFSDMGWFATTIRHTPLRDTETAQDYTVVATVQSDGTVTPGSVKLLYAINNGPLTTRTMTATGTSGQYRAVIPNPGLGATVTYYLSASDDETGRTYAAPGQPAPGASRVYYQFHVGPDTTPPTAAHTPPVFLFAQQFPYSLVVLADDNLGVASVRVNAALNGVAQTPLTLAPQADGLTYIGELTSGGQQLSTGDVLTYNVVVTDRAARPNTTTLGPFTVPIVALKNAQRQYANTFNAASSDFIGAGFTVTQPAGFANPAIHTAHPYPDATDLVYQLLVPIVVEEDSTKATVKFDEIALVEPGESDSRFGDPNFYDYVVVEASTDGTHWSPLASGYDAHDNQRWLSRWYSALDANGNSTAGAVPALYAPRTFNLRRSFGGGTIVQLRFRLSADELTHGWGWSIDNLAIQTTSLTTPPEPLVSSGLQAFPNPSTDRLVRVQATLADPATDLRLEVRNVLGQVLRQQTLAGTSTTVNQTLDLRTLPAGLYLLALRDGTKTTSTCKVLLR